MLTYPCFFNAIDIGWDIRMLAKPFLPNIESHPYPRNLAYSYSGKLASRFLLSFTDEQYVFDEDTLDAVLV